MAKQLLNAFSLTCVRNNQILFDELSMEIIAGNIIQIEGDNGTGKTSLLRILAGLSQPYEGQVSYQGKPINQCREDYYQDLTFIGHRSGVKSELNTRQNITFNLAMQGDKIEHLTQAIDAVNLTGFEHVNTAYLSAGQQRRVALARLWQSNSRIWILDEPFTAIDKAGIALLEQLFVKHTSNGGVVIFTSHQELQLPPDNIIRINIEDYS